MIYSKKLLNPMLLKRKGKKEKIIIKIRKMSPMIKQIKKIKVITIIYVRKLNNINCNSKMKLFTKNKE
jgi:pimeloyl-CoA synthetase